MLTGGRSRDFFCTTESTGMNSSEFSNPEDCIMFSSKARAQPAGSSSPVPPGSVKVEQHTV